MQELLSNRWIEGREKEEGGGGRKWSLSVRAKYEKWSVDVPVAMEKAERGLQRSRGIEKAEGPRH